ncbi:MAG: ABC transporter ATP-binding protein [Gemella sp.]|nr:ABC transporter ATP-binding protein [Gemella sp.]
MIKFTNLQKVYDTKIALDNLSMEIKDGEIFGLIGHNGAGKSTAIKSLVSAIDFTSGEIYFDNKKLTESRFECKKELFYIPDNPDMFLMLSALEYWNLVADIYSIDKKTREERIETYAKMFNIYEDRFSAIDSFSHGMRQKTFIIGALVASPRYWILDEPLTGLDPQAAFDLKEIMRKHKENGNTVLFSTHILEVAENLCDRIGILSKGKLLFVGTLEELKAKYQGESLEKIYLDIIKSNKIESGE